MLFALKHTFLNKKKINKLFHDHPLKIVFEQMIRREFKYEL